MDKKMRITKFDFKTPFLSNGQHTHLALVDEGANLKEVLVLKSKSTKTTKEQTEYNDDGSSKYQKQSVSVRDYGDDIVYVTEEVYQILDYTVSK